MERVAIGLSNLQVPLGIRLPRVCGADPIDLTGAWCVGHFNSAIPDDERELLALAADDLRDNGETLIGAQWKGLAMRAALAQQVCDTEPDRREHDPTERDAPDCAMLRERDRVDDFSDLDEDALVVVAISGGGARAGMLAAHTMALLERQYNAALGIYCSGDAPCSFPTRPGARPLVELVDAYSTVSGGSLYAFLVARWHARCANPRHDVARRSDDPIARLLPWVLSEDRPKSCDPLVAFRTILDEATRVKELGFRAADGYLAPGNLMIYPLMTLLADRSFTDLLAGVLENNVYALTGFAQTGLRFADLPRRPRFLFNSVLTPYGTPFVFSQMLMNLPFGSPPERTARLDVRPGEEFAADSHAAEAAMLQARPLRHSLMLEDLNSAPSQFPVAWAALASAAYPVGFEPVRLLRYRYDRSTGSVVPTDTIVDAVDGGIYDNSGLTTALDLADFLQHTRKNHETTRRLVLLAINAEITASDSTVASGFAPQRSIWNKLPIEFRSPIGSLGAAIESLNLIHYLNKQRSEASAGIRINGLAKDWEPADCVTYLPVNLSQLSASDLLSLPEGQHFFDLLQHASTDMIISDEDADLLGWAADYIISSDQRSLRAKRVLERGSEDASDMSWKSCWNADHATHRLGAAFVDAMLSAQELQEGASLLREIDRENNTGLH